jgi:hypothetical protein
MLLTLSYNARDFGPNYTFYITSDHEFMFDIDTMYAIVYRRGLFENDKFTTIPNKVLLDERILTGEMTFRDAPGGFLDCTVVLRDCEAIRGVVS